MIFPVVLSFDKEIAFGNRTRIKRRSRANNGGGKKSIFPLVGYTAAGGPYTIFVSFTFMCEDDGGGGGVGLITHRDP